jgi:hypothetical protein
LIAFPHERVEALSRAQLDRSAEKIRELLLEPEQLDEAQPLLIRVDEEIDVAVLARLVARHGAEQVKRHRAASPDFRLGGLEACNDFIPAHAANLVQRL